MKTELKKIKNINPVLGLLSLSACGGSAITNTALNKPVINYSINENSIFDKDTSDLFSSEVINYTISGADAGSFLVLPGLFAGCCTEGAAKAQPDEFLPLYS